MREMLAGEVTKFRGNHRLRLPSLSNGERSTTFEKFLDELLRDAMNNNVADLLLEHFEKYLSVGESSWIWEKMGRIQFYVLKYPFPFHHIPMFLSLVACPLTICR
jgi:hypothetical protein